jgi:hypothetical protein
MLNTPQLYDRFEQLIEALYVAEGYIPLSSQREARDQGYDFLLRSPRGETVAIEVKLHRTAVINRGRVSEMLRRAAGVLAITKVDRMILVIGSKIGIPFADTFGVEVVDLQKIMEMAAPHPELFSSFEALFREVSPRATPEDILAAHIFGHATLPFPTPDNLTMLTASEHLALKPRTGVELAEALRRVNAGKNEARQFEIKALEALRYIFNNDLSGWSEQQVTRGGLSRYDVIARISSDHDFWRSITAFFKSWYVVFEFKNYTKTITQKEITSTEKYLYSGAMRMVAFVVSQRGASDNALEMARGALREQGKLIVNLSVEDVCEMIRIKDDDSDPNGFLHDMLDTMLMRLDR